MLLQLIRDVHIPVVTTAVRPILGHRSYFDLLFDQLSRRTYRATHVECETHHWAREGASFASTFMAHFRAQKRSIDHTFLPRKGRCAYFCSTAYSEAAVHLVVVG